MKKKLTFEEVQFIHEILKSLIGSHDGCTFPELGSTCPYWFPGDDKTPPSCTVKKSNRVCTKLELPLVDESLVLEVREKKTADYVQELESELNQRKHEIGKIVRAIHELDNQRKKAQREVESIELRKNRLAKEDREDEEE